MNLVSPEAMALLVPIIGLVLISSAARAIYFELFEKHFNLAFADAPTWSFLYFGAWAAFVVLLFPAKVASLISGITPTGYFLVVFMMLGVFPALYYQTRIHGGAPVWLLMLFPKEGLLTLGDRYILSKISDVIFQQLIAGVLILTLAAHGVAYPTIVAVFVGLFGAAHLYIFRTDGLFWGLHYTMYAIMGGFAFPFLIIFVPGGIAYATLLHMLFYVLSGVYFAKLPRPEARVSRELTGAAPLAAV